MNKASFLYGVCIIFMAMFSVRLDGTENGVSARAEKKRCLGCAIHQGEVATIGGLVAESLYFEVRQDYTVPIPGFMIVTSKRHVQSIDDFTSAERLDYIEFVYQVRRNMRECLGITEVTLVQEENSSHFHVWLFPWYSWMDPFGKDIVSLRTIMRYAQEHFTTQVHIDAVHNEAQKLSAAFFDSTHT